MGRFKELFGAGSGNPYGKKKSSYVPPGDLPSLVSFLRRICIRHTKGQKVYDTGKALLQLPPKTTTIKYLDFSPNESKAYNALENAARTEYKALKVGSCMGDTVPRFGLG